MKKGRLVFFTFILVAGISYGFLQPKGPVQNKILQKAQTVQASAIVAPKKVKTTLAVDDPLLSCSSKQYVCEKAVLPPKQIFSYSNYIWANAGQTITFGVTTPGENIGIWIESEDGTFGSDVQIIQPNGKQVFTVDAPFDGNFRVVLQGKNKNQTRSVHAYIKDPWS